MIKRMHARVMFDREIVKDYHSIMPGGRDGYEMKFGDNAVCFEFCDFYGYVDKTDPRIMDIKAENLDYVDHEKIGVYANLFEITLTKELKIYQYSFQAKHLIQYYHNIILIDVYCIQF